MNKTDFQIASEAVLLYYQQHSSLFADHFISEKLQISSTTVREKIVNCFHASPEDLIIFLGADRIRRCIAETMTNMKNHPPVIPVARIEPMTHEETDQGGESLAIHFRFADTFFGPVIMASTTKGVCYIAFSDRGNDTAFNQLKSRFPCASFEEGKDSFQEDALSAFESSDLGKRSVSLHVKGTPFQISTWNKLLRIPSGGLMSYSALASDKKDSHALGAAVGSNPIAYLIPCHRTVRASGEFGEYHWGKARKAALICLEATGSQKGEYRFI